MEWAAPLGGGGTCQPCSGPFRALGSFLAQWVWSAYLRSTCGPRKLSLWSLCPHARPHHTHRANRTALCTEPSPWHLILLGAPLPLACVPSLLTLTPAISFTPSWDFGCPRSSLAPALSHCVAAWHMPHFGSELACSHPMPQPLIAELK